MGKKSRGWHRGGWWRGGGEVAIWLLTRRGGKADRAEGTEMAGGREEEITLEGQHAPLLPRQKAATTCVCMLVCVPLTDNAADWIQRGGLCPDSTDATSLDTAWSVRVTESQREKKKKVCASLSMLGVLSVCVCVCGPAWVSASQPGSSVCAWGGSLPAGWARCSVAPSRPLALPLLLPSRPAQSTATCYQINISSHRGQHVIPPLRGQTTHC